MVVRDPGFIVLASGSSSGLGTGKGGFGVGNGLLGLLGGARRALCLGEEGLNPGLVNKVQGASESGGEDEVEENTARESVHMSHEVTSI